MNGLIDYTETACQHCHKTEGDFELEKKFERQPRMAGYDPIDPFRYRMRCLKCNHLSVWNSSQYHTWVYEILLFPF